jgi:hypothetical protein
VPEDDISSLYPVLRSQLSSGLMATLRRFRIFPIFTALSSGCFAIFPRKVDGVLRGPHLSFNLDQRPSGAREEKMELVGQDTRLPFGKVNCPLE